MPGSTPICSSSPRAGDLAKGMNQPRHQFRPASCVRSNSSCETWASELQDDAGEGAEVQPPKPLIAAAQWYSMGQQILKAIVNDANGEGDVGG